MKLSDGSRGDEGENTKVYLLLDARAGITLADNVDPEKYTLLVGSAAECCHAANSGEYGKGCVVSDADGNIMWEWFTTGKWRSHDRGHQEEARTQESVFASVPKRGP